MPYLDFKEIPASNETGSDRDLFELFGREFCHALGYEIVEDPSRGPDGGKDFIVTELREGVGGSTTIRWMVSCKHFAHSGNAVSENDESNVLERVQSFKCNGFMGIYSTVATTGFTQRLEGLKAGGNIEYLIYDPVKIERQILADKKLWPLGHGFFPKTFLEWKLSESGPAEVYEGHDPPHCENCGKDLIQSGMGIFVFQYRKHDKHRKKVGFYLACKGRCDRELAARRNDLWSSGWEDVEDMKIPVLYLREVMAFLNQTRTKGKFSDEAFDKFKKFLIHMFPYVSRNTNSEGAERAAITLELKSYGL